MEQLQCVRQAFDSGEMEASAGRDFDTLQLPINQLSILLKWPKNDFERCLNYFYRVSSTPIDSLPIEVLELILLRVFVIHFCPLSSRSFEKDTLKWLCSVSRNWTYTITRHRFKLAENRLVMRFLNTIFKIRAIIRNNKRFLQENLKPNILIDPLVSAGCLNMKQAMLINGKLLNRRDRNYELLKVIRSFPFEKQLDFLDCLRSFQQHRVADVIEKGGVTAKLCIKNVATPNVRLFEKDLVDKLQKMLGENSNERLMLNSDSLHDSIILRAQHGRGLIKLWLWCQSQEALESLRDIDADELIKITKQLFSRFQSPNSPTPQNAYIDSSYFQFNLVVRRVSAKLRGTLLCPFGQRSTGWFRVSSLQDKIYVSSDRAIYIYEGKSPYRELEYKINLPQPRLLHPLELVACHVYNCLYIVDLALNCIWKMNPADNYGLKKWLSEPLPKLSVSSDGKVLLILDKNGTHPQLRIYTSDSELESTIPMRGDSYTYSWAAVELMPGVVAVQYEKFGSKLLGMLKGISVMRLNETGDILRDVECEGIFRLAPYSSGRLIAVDQDANEVILLDDQLKRLQVILSNEKRGLRWPRCFCYRKDTRELIVDHFGYSVVSGHYQFDVCKLSFSDD